MLSRRAFVAGTIGLLATPHVAKAAGFTVHLFGDSIASGYALGRFPPQVSPTDPLYPFRSIASMANMVLEENVAPATFSYLGLGVNSNGAAETLAEFTNRSQIRAGDWVIFEDAGPHTPDPAAYESNWAALIDAVNAPGVNIALLTMFDYPPAPADCMYDAGQPSMNDATRSAATTANVTLIDCNASMDNWRASAKSIDGVDVMHPDGIHPNVWGQMRMTSDILRVIGLQPLILSARSVQNVAGTNYRTLAYGADSRWNARRAETYCAYHFLA